MAPMIGGAGPARAGPSQGAGFGVGRTGGCAGGGGWSPGRGGAAVAALPAGHAPGAGPRGKRGARSRWLAGRWRGSAGRAVQVWRGRPARCHFSAAERGARAGERPLAGIPCGREGYPGSGCSFAALVRGISSGIENACTAHPLPKSGETSGTVDILYLKYISSLWFRTVGDTL